MSNSVAEKGIALEKPRSNRPGGRFVARLSASLSAFGFCPQAEPCPLAMGKSSLRKKFLSKFLAASPPLRIPLRRLLRFGPRFSPLLLRDASSKQYLSRLCPGFTLIDILIGMTISSLLVILFTMFVRDVYRFTAFVEKHRQLRAETFAMMNFSIPSLIREATAIDYSQTNTNQLALFMDKAETQKIIISKSPETFVPLDDVSQMTVKTSSKTWVLNSRQTVIEDFKITVTPNPRSASDLKYSRTLQPMVKISMTARRQRLEPLRTRTVFSFWEDPKISYQSAFTLRNYSVGNLRSP